MMMIDELKQVWTSLNTLGVQDIATIASIQLLADKVNRIASRVEAVEKSIALGKN
jgi:hypothetical protein